MLNKDSNFIRKNFSKKAILIYSYLLLLAVTVFLSFGYAGGITGRTKKGGNSTGCYCHGDTPFPNVNVSINGPDTVTPGGTINYIIKIAGGPLVRGGTDIAVFYGETNPVGGSGLQKIGDELTHDFPKLPSGAEVSFHFTYTAPNTEVVDTIFANGNSVNFDLLPYNDNWNFAQNKVIIVKNPIGIHNSGETVLSYSLEQNFPNPFNPVTLIQFVIKENVFAELTIYDLIGRKLETLVREKLSSGIHKVKWDASGYASGIYVYKLSAGDFIQSRKMTFVK